MDRNSYELENRSTTVSKPKLGSLEYNNSFDLDYDNLMKLVVIGDTWVGKSALIKKYTDGYYSCDPYCSTIGVEFAIKRLEFDGSDISIDAIHEPCMATSKRNNSRPENTYRVKAQIWDSAGQECFRTIIQPYYRGMKICIICFDATKYTGQRSIFTIQNWLDEIAQYANSHVNVYVIGTKADPNMNPRIKINEKSNIVDRLRFTQEVETEIESIKSYESLDVTFLGWCSSKEDVYVENITDFDDMLYDPTSNKYYWSEPAAHRKNIDIDNGKRAWVTNIDDMFDKIIIDHLTSDKGSNAVLKRDFYPYIDSNNAHAEPGRSCCIIL